MQVGGHFDIFEFPRRIFHFFHIEKSGRVIQKDDAW